MLHVKDVKKILKLAKGFRGGLSKLFRPANQVVLHALKNATEHRKLRKRDFRSLWIVRLNAALKQRGQRYSTFINLAKEKNVELDRKTLSELAINHPAAFDEVVNVITK